MKIVFKNEQELADGIFGSDIDVKAFTMILLNRLGIEPGKMIQRKLGSIQEKHDADRTEYDSWRERQGKVFSTQDVVKATPFWAELSLNTAREHLRTLIGQAKRGSIWYNDFRYYNGEYYFNEDGCHTVTYLLYNKGYFSESDLETLRNDLGLNGEAQEKKKKQ